MSEKIELSKKEYHEGDVLVAENLNDIIDMLTFQNNIVVGTNFGDYEKGEEIETGTSIKSLIYNLLTSESQITPSWKSFTEIAQKQEEQNLPQTDEKIEVEEEQEEEEQL